MTDQPDYSEMIERLHSNAGVTAQTATDRLLIEAAAAIKTLRDELFEERCTYRSLAAENDRLRGEQSNLQKMQTAPEGWKLAPVEPTPELLRRARMAAPAPVGDGWRAGIKGIVAYDLDAPTVTLVMDSEGAVRLAVQSLKPANRAFIDDDLPLPPATSAGE